MGSHRRENGRERLALREIGRERKRETIRWEKDWEQEGQKEVKHQQGCGSAHVGIPL